MGIAVRWQVTTGRFTFKWTDYDRVAPSQEILRNPDFYAGQVTQDKEALVDTAVRCEPLEQEIATSVARPAPERHAALAAAPAVPAPISALPAPEHKTAVLPEDGKPSCDGGMVRQIATGAQSYICLCPGNTARISTGGNGFACEKRLRRR
jgi:hypothetical protein